MSAFFSMVHHGVVQVLTDGAVYKPDGTLISIEQKIYYSDRLPVAITGRGNSEKLRSAAMGLLRFDMFGSVDKLLAYVADFAKQAENRNRTAPLSSSDAFELLICAFSETAGPVTFYFTTHSYSGVEAMRLHMVQDMVFGAGGDITDGDLSSIGVTAQQYEEEGLNFLRKRGVEIFELMRNRKGKNPVRPEQEIYGIGGHCQLTTISESGVVVETLKVWPDKVGEKIDPFRVEQAHELEDA
ncbi:hypothetical protein [Agrobacterium pusense]|uniref:Uncharacterized protein n=1 Tax=Agrobacterium pusense TaxID=648995 RepID=A0AA44EJ11_9HYPH|nr:hypothetical protein [Agrobacterium pusense]NRF09401.1 hypothetical protein [Agrobacterium pusense]NRF19694.1 hypothetical protein [Agrobacterium pusense]